MTDVGGLVIRINEYLSTGLLVRGGPDNLLRHVRDALLELAAEVRQAKEERDLAEQLLTEHSKTCF